MELFNILYLQYYENGSDVELEIIPINKYEKLRPRLATRKTRFQIRRFNQNKRNSKEIGSKLSPTRRKDAVKTAALIKKRIRERKELIYIKRKDFKFKVDKKDKTKYDFGYDVFVPRVIIDRMSLCNVPGVMIRDFVTYVVKKENLHKYSLTGRVANVHINNAEIKAKESLPGPVIFATKTFIQTMYPDFPMNEIYKTIRSHLSNSNYAKKFNKNGAQFVLE